MQELERSQTAAQTVRPVPARTLQRTSPPAHSGPGQVSTVERLPLPSALRHAVPIEGKAADTVLRGRREVRDILHGNDDRLLVIAGPCSIHDRGSALAYGEALCRLQEETRDRLSLVMRTYFEKPRTTVGWKGLLNDPGLDGSFDVVGGLSLARRILAEINAMEMPCGSELLDPLAARYLEDGIAWAAIGARTSASQVHREAASGWPMPVGLKNDVAGDIAIATQGVEAVRKPHHFVGVDAEGQPSVLRSPGNPDAHVILRGGRSGPNHGADSVAQALALLPADAPMRPVVVDCSHGNSEKQHERQAEALRSVLAQRRAGQQRLAGVMLESHLEPGRQDWGPTVALRAGLSITDACLGWEETRALLLEAAAQG